MKKILLALSLISVFLLAGCNKNENVANLNIPENTGNQEQEVANNNENQGEKESSENRVYSFTKREEIIDNITYEIFENDNVVIKFEILEETHDYSQFEGYSLHNQTSYFEYLDDYASVNLVEQDDKLLVELYSESAIESCILKGNLLSMVLKSPTYPGTEYNVLNIDIHSKKILDVAEFIEFTGKHKEALESAVKPVAYNLTREYSEELPNTDSNKNLTELNFEENFDFSRVQFYFNELGNLSSNFETYFGVPGMGAAKYLYDLELNEEIGRIWGY